MKYFSLFMISLFILLAVACGQDTSLRPGFGREDLYLLIGSAQYSLNMDIEKVIADFGPDYDYAEARSCDYDGLDKSFLYDHAEFYTFPLKEGDRVSDIYSSSPDASTSKGIRVGAEKADVFAFYGEDCEDTGYQLIYAIEGGSLCFDMEDGVVKAFYITARKL